MKQIYKQIYEDEETGKFYFMSDTNSIEVFDLQSYCQCLTIDLLVKLLNKEKEEDEEELEEPFLSNEKGDKIK